MPSLLARPGIHASRKQADPQLLDSLKRGLLGGDGRPKFRRSFFTNPRDHFDTENSLGADFEDFLISCGA
jgi:hypothetical protein